MHPCMGGYRYFLHPTSSHHILPESTAFSIIKCILFHTQKKQSEASGTNPIPRPLPALNLFADFRSVTEGEPPFRLKLQVPLASRAIDTTPTADDSTAKYFITNRTGLAVMPIHLQERCITVILSLCLQIFFWSYRIFFNKESHAFGNNR